MVVSAVVSLIELVIVEVVELLLLVEMREPERMLPKNLLISNRTQFNLLVEKVTTVVVTLVPPKSLGQEKCNIVNEVYLNLLVVVIVVTVEVTIEVLVARALHE